MIKFIKTGAKTKLAELDKKKKNQNSKLIKYKLDGLSFLMYIIY